MAVETLGVVLVFVIILVARILFLTEPVPVNVRAIGIMVELMILGPVDRHIAAQRFLWLFEPRDNHDSCDY